MEIPLEGGPVITRRFDHHGRLYGGFWINMRKADRWHLRIGGERITILDYGQSFTRMLYARAGTEPPEGDLYSIPVWRVAETA